MSARDSRSTHMPMRLPPETSRPWGPVIAGLVVTYFLVFVAAVFALAGAGNLNASRSTIDHMVWAIAASCLGHFVLTALLLALRFDKAAQWIAWCVPMLGVIGLSIGTIYLSAR